MNDKIYFRLLFSIFLVGLSFSSFSQTTITIQPDSAEGKDANVWEFNPNNNYGSSTEFTIYAWTNSGTPALRRCFIDFDFSSIPLGATITNAELTLYNYANSPSTNGEHSQLSGSNELVVQRIISTWDEHTINWNNQPNTSILNQIIVPASSSVHQDYIIDVTPLVQDILSNTSNSFGFGIKLQTEQYYRSAIFASSDIGNPALHPKLTVTYTMSTSINEDFYEMSDISFYPNPFNDLASINISAKKSLAPFTIKLVNTYGEIVRESTIETNKFIFDRNNLTPGLYLLNIYSSKILIGTIKIIAQ